MPTARPKIIRLRATIQRKQADLPAFVVVPSTRLRSWNLTATTTVTGTVNGHDVGRRSLKQWDEERWFVELPSALCRSASLSPGTEVDLVIQLADDALPSELTALLQSNVSAAECWSHMSPSRQRMLREEIVGAKSSTTRASRAARALTGTTALPRSVARGANTRGTAHAVSIRIVVEDPIPGVALAIQDKHDHLIAPTETSRAATVFDLTLNVIEAADGLDFRGACVHGTPGQRFIYVNAGTRAGQAESCWDRRAKIRLRGITAQMVESVVGGTEQGRIEARIASRAQDGGPACGSVPLHGDWICVRARIAAGKARSSK